MKRTFALVFISLFISQNAYPQIIEDVARLGKIKFPPAGDENFIHSDVWGFTRDGREYAVLARSESGVSIVDVTDPAHPVEASFIPKPANTQRLYHCKPYNGYIYAVMRPGPLQIIDARDPYNATTVKEYSENFSECYSIIIADSIAHLTDVVSATEGVSHIMLDISDPENPVEVGTWHRSYHHVFVRNDTLIGFALKGEVDLIDISDPAGPDRFMTFNAGDDCHSGWLNDTGTILTTDHENPGGHLKLWDISNDPPTLIDEFLTPTNNEGETAIHHSRWYGDRIYTSYWQDGFRVVDASNPTNLLQEAVYDTIDPNQDDALYRGNWGVYPYAPSRNVYVSSPSEGLWILDYQHDGPGIRHDPIKAIAGGSAKVRFKFQHLNGGLPDSTQSYIYWRHNHDATWQKTAGFISAGDSSYFFEITPEEGSVYLDYYLKIEGTQGQWTRVPGLAPDLDYYRLHIGDDPYIDDLYISEVSDAASTAGEFLEIHNRSDSECNLNQFKIVQYGAGSDGNYNTAEFIFDIDSDAVLQDADTTVPANGFLIIGRGVSQTEFEGIWGALPEEAHYNSGADSLEFGGQAQKRWILFSGGNFDQPDGLIVDDSQLAIAGAQNRSYQNRPGHWKTTDYQSANPGFLDNDQSLPVELIAFKGAYEKNHVLLQWQTRSEFNHLGFNILRRCEFTEQYTPIASHRNNDSLKAVNNGAFGKQYHYRDFNLTANARHHYILQAVDVDGSVSEYGPVTIDVDARSPAINAFRLSHPYPNPFNPSTQVEVDFPDQHKPISAEITIYNYRGQMVKQLFKGLLYSGSYRFQWHGRNEEGKALPSGLYYLRFHSADFNTMRKLLLLR